MTESLFIHLSFSYLLAFEVVAFVAFALLYEYLKHCQLPCRQIR